MEKIISQEERIRRAEEIYYRRKLNNNNVRMPSSQVKQGRENRQFSLYKKMVLQILICIFIYLIFSLIKETNYIFSESVINKTKEFLSIDINFAQISSNIGDFFQNNQDKFSFLTRLWNKEENINSENQNNESEESNNIENNITNEQTNSENNNENEEINGENTNLQNSESSQNSQVENNEEKKATISNENVGIGGNSKIEQTVQVSAAETSSKKTQMEIDAEYIKKNFSMVLPAKAKITSSYGKREPTEIVSENHQGIDIGVNVGTTVVAAMEGKVSLVSNEGSYGTHVKIEKDDITTIYAHCSKILVKEGQEVKLGQKIALSGNTGNTTGPHLHFEIRRSGRTINPELILKW